MSAEALIDMAVRSGLAVQRMRPWTANEDQYLADSMREMSYEQLSARLGRTIDAIKVRQVKKQIPGRSKTPGYLTANKVANLLGTDIHAITKLIRRGKLRMETLHGERLIRSISITALYVWAINPRNWIFFQAERVSDSRLRRMIGLRRERWNNDWWTTGQVADYWGLAGTNAVNSAIYRGSLPAVRWGNWFVLRSDAIAHPIYAGKGSATGRAMWSERADAFLLMARAEGRSFAEIGRMMKWPHQRVAYRYRQITKWSGNGSE